MKNTILCLILVMAIFSVSLATGASNPIVLMQTNYGDIELELFIDDAPITVANFLEYVDSGFYNGLIFHRVMEDFMIQGGGFDQGKNKMDTNDPIVNESSNGLSNVRGTITMARLGGVADSATSQFFINQVDNSSSLEEENSSDGIGYCVFGQVVSGMDTVDAIAAVDTNDSVLFPTGEYDAVPVEDVIILNAQYYNTLVSPDGNDSNSATPFATIQAAVDSTEDGRTIVLEPGIYTGVGNCDIVFGGKTMIIASKESSEIDPIAATIIDCNGSAGNEHQGFILDQNDNVTIKNLTITGGYSRFGAAVYSEYATVTIENCVIMGNVGTFDGGGICLVSSDGYIKNCTIADNSTTYNRYGIIYCVNATATVSNCILSNESYDPEIYTYKSTAAVSYCNVNGGYEGGGNIDVEPIFADVNNGNYHLASQGWQWDTTTDSWSFGSETNYCIDAGDPALDFSDEPEISTIDPNNTRASRNLRVNMGAYANKATASVGSFADFNGDNLVNFTDYAMMMNSFMETELTLLDINRDGSIDYNDLSMLAEDWTKGSGNGS